jgi:hypothetical protein
MSPVVHIGDKAEEELPQVGDGLLYLGGDNPNARLEAIPDSLPPPPFLITYYDRYHRMSPVVHIGDKAEEELPQVVDGLLYLVGDNPNAGLEAIPDSLPLPQGCESRRQTFSSITRPRFPEI